MYFSLYLFSFNDTNWEHRRSTRALSPDISSDFVTRGRKRAWIVYSRPPQEKPYEISGLKPQLSAAFHEPAFVYTVLIFLFFELKKIFGIFGSIRFLTSTPVKKVYKPCKYDAWDIELSEANNKPTTEAMVIEKPTVSKPPVPDKPETKEEYKPKPFTIKDSETYNLTLMPPEETAINGPSFRQWPQPGHYREY